MGREARAMSTPIFLLGPPRSGTTLLRWIIDTHPNIHCPGETHFLTRVRDLFVESWPLHIEGYPPAAILRQLRGLVEGVMGELASRAGKRRWAEKSPQHALVAEFIHRLFEGQCRFVVLMRHGLDVAASISDRAAELRPDMMAFIPPELGLGSGFRDLPLLTGAQIWARYSERLRHFVALHPDDCSVVRYEDLVADPEPTARRIFEFVGEELPDGLIERVFRTNHGTGMGDPKIAETKRIERDRVGRWKMLSPAVIASLAATVDTELAAWGYEPVG
jgi:protein-tyrosine sulfotransferase